MQIWKFNNIFKVSTFINSRCDKYRHINTAPILLFEHNLNYLQPAVNRQPGFPGGTRGAGALNKKSIERGETKQLKQNSTKMGEDRN